MKTSNDAKMTVCSIAVTLSILLITLGVYLGTQYLDENYVKYDVEQMLNIYYEISDPVEKEGENIIIDKRWIVKSVIGKRIYSQLSTQDGVNFFSDYARKQDWAICTNRWDLDNRTGKRTYYLTLKKKEITCYIEHEEESEIWRFWIQKDDIFRKLGL
ncbi:MAG: hypothetical protein JNG41_00255 [Dialister sp.]|nr:hypothetical protein [Dialister sp.]